LPNRSEATVRAVEVLEKGISNGVQIGAQLYVSRDGSAVADVALGDARTGVPMTNDTLMIWYSMTKATTSVAVAQQWERGAFDIDDPVARYIPEFGTNGKERITMRHLLTHTAGIPWADGLLEAWPWREPRAENLARIYASAPDYPAGTRAGYHAAAGMSVLGAVVEEVSGLTFDRYVRAEIFEPLGMDDCWVGMPVEQYDAYGDRIGIMHATVDPPAAPVKGVDGRRQTSVPLPGANGRGPMRQLARLYEMLVGGGVRDGVRLLSPQTVAAISARHRVGMLDETFGVPLDWGLGFAIDTYITGRHCSPRAFGHGGHQSSAAFCDPEYGIVVAVVCNGMPGGDAHSSRMDAIATAVYEDLGFTGPGREKIYPLASF
jgi:CubicO group peptidase (beta-lactamase class C family)